MEETFSVYNTNLSEENFVVALHDMGFQSDSTVDQQCNGRSGANSPIILARAQKKKRSPKQPKTPELWSIKSQKFKIKRPTVY